MSYKNVCTGSTVRLRLNMTSVSHPSGPAPTLATLEGADFGMDLRRRRISVALVSGVCYNIAIAHATKANLKLFVFEDLVHHER